VRKSWFLLCAIGLVGGCSPTPEAEDKPAPKAAVPVKQETKFIRVLQAGGQSGSDSETFELKGREQKLEWSVTTPDDPPLSITMHRRTGDFGLMVRPTVIVPKVAPGTLKGTERVLLEPGRWFIRVDCRGGWTVRVLDSTE
jgi:hypothetical protein